MAVFSQVCTSLSTLTLGSADQLVILWDEDGHAMSRFKGYPEPVRGLALMTDHETFVSGCNDG